MKLWRKSNDKPITASVTEKDEVVENPCPICEYLHLGDEYHGRSPHPIRKQNSRVAGVEYGMCAEHQRVVSAHKEIESTMRMTHRHSLDVPNVQ